MGSQILEDAQKFLFLHNTMRKDMQEGKVPVIVRGDGNYIFDEEGKRYLDLVAGNTRPNGIGYGREEVAKAMYEQALKMNPNALDGSAYNSLAALYYKVPGWPIGFGDKAKAKELLDKAVAINPKGIDANFFYGEYLVETGKPAEAIAYLERALAAPSRPGRDVADAGRREETKALLEKVRAQVAAR